MVIMGEIIKPYFFKKNPGILEQPRKKKVKG